MKVLSSVLYRVSQENFIILLSSRKSENFDWENFWQNRKVGAFISFEKISNYKLEKSRENPILGENVQFCRKSPQNQEEIDLQNLK